MSFDPDFPYYTGPPTTGPTSNSPINLNLGQVPDVDDEKVYRALLDIYNALEILQAGSDNADAFVVGFINKQRNNTEVTGDYTIEVTDGTLLVDASAGDITITAHPVSEGEGYLYNIKRVDEVPINKVTLLGDGTEFIDGRASGIAISTKSSYTIKSNDTGWAII